MEILITREGEEYWATEPGHEEVREWNDKFENRGYRLVTDQNDQSGYLQLDTGYFVTGWPETRGVNLALWNDFFNSFTADDFTNDGDYLDAVENRFNILWHKWADD